MAKTPAKKSIPPAKSKGKASSAKPVAKSAKPTGGARKAPPVVAKKAVTAATPKAAPAKKSPPVVAAKAPAKAVATVTPAKAPVAVAKVPAAKAPAKGKLSAKQIIEANKPVPIMLVPRTPSNGKPTAAATVATKPSKKKAKEKKAPVEPAYRPPLQESVPTDGKPRKNQAGLTARELEHFRDLLLEKRREIVGDMSSMEREALRSGGGGLSSLPVHMADMGTDNYEQEFTLGLVEKDRNLLRDLNAALAKIQNGTYGLCEGTGKPINKVRLEAQPWAKFSIEHARALERQRGLR